MQNKIKFRLLHGKENICKIEGNTLIYSHSFIKKIEIITINTDKIFFVGDYIGYHEYYTRITDRVYYPEKDYYIFCGTDCYTGE